MASLGIVYIWLLFIIHGLAHHGTSSPVQNRKCDLLFQAVMRLRDDLYYKRERLLLPDNAAQLERMVTTYYNKRYGATVDDSYKLREVVCCITDITTIEELAEFTASTYDGIKGTLEVFEFVYKEILLKEWSIMQPYLLNTHSWLVKSGFPDTWPLSVTYNETMNFINGHDLPRSGKTEHNFSMAKRKLIALLAFNEQLPSGSLAVALSHATSLDDYLARINVIREDNPRFNVVYTYLLNLKMDSFVREIVSAAGSVFSFCETFIQIVIPQFRQYFDEPYQKGWPPE